jgi:hypothetical protein
VRQSQSCRRNQVTALARIVTVPRNKLQVAPKLPDVDNVKGGALAAA